MYCRREGAEEDSLLFTVLSRHNPVTGDGRRTHAAKPACQRVQHAQHAGNMCLEFAPTASPLLVTVGKGALATWYRVLGMHLTSHWCLVPVRMPCMTRLAGPQVGWPSRLGLNGDDWVNAFYSAFIHRQAATQPTPCVCTV
jgi:hypothetical protein